MIYLLPSISATLGAILSFSLFRSKHKEASVLASFLALVFSIFLLFEPDSFTAFFYVDSLSKIFLLMISSVYLGVVIFSIGYLEHSHGHLVKSCQYFSLLDIFVGIMLFSVTLNNFGLFWVSIEGTTFATALLVASENDIAALEAAWRYIMIVSVGLTIGLVGTLFLYSSAHTLSITDLLSRQNQGSLFFLSGMLLVVGYGTKIGIFPMYTWLPDAHGKAPAPISAIFSAVLLPVSLYPLIRFFEVYQNPSLSKFAFVLGFLSVMTGSIMTLNQRLYKRLFAYSSVENMGLSLIGVSLGSYALFGTIVLIFTHAFAKSGVFMLTGNMLHELKTRKIEDVKGLIKIMPKTGLFLFFGALAVTGTPPFATFFGELLIVSKTINYYGWTVGFALFFFLVCGFLFINYRVINMVFNDETKPVSSAKESPFTFVPVIFITLAAFVILIVPIFYRFIEGVIK